MNQTAYRQHQLPVCAAYDSQQWFRTMGPPACSRLPPSGSLHSRAPVLHPWPAAAALCRTRQTCRGNVRRTWERKKQTGGRVSEETLTRLEVQRRFVYTIIVSPHTHTHTHTSHRWDQPADYCQQNRACWGGLWWSWRPPLWSPDWCLQLRWSESPSPHRAAWRFASAV